MLEVQRPAVSPSLLQLLSPCPPFLSTAHGAITTAAAMEVTAVATRETAKLR